MPEGTVLSTLVQDLPSNIDEMTPVEPALSVVPPTDGSPPAEGEAPSQKFLGHFDSEEHALQSLNYLAQQKAEFDAFKAQQQAQIEAQQRQQMMQSDEGRRRAALIEEKNLVAARVDALQKAGRADEAFFEAAEFQKRMLMGDFQSAVAAEVARVMDPHRSTAEFKANPSLAHLHQYAEIAVELENTGMPHAKIIQLLETIDRTGQEKVRQPLQEHIQRKYMEAADAGLVETASDKQWRAAGANIFGKMNGSRWKR